MTSSTRVQLNNQISEEAAEWFVDFRCGNVDAAGRHAFEAWVRSSPEHLRAYLEHAALWNEGDAVDAACEIDVDALIAGAAPNIVSLPPAAPSPSPAKAGEGWRGGRRFAIAATVLLAIAGTAAFFYLKHVHVSVYSTEAGEQRSLRLPDGSTVTLNSRSQLRVQFNDRSERRLELLEGQALFGVAHDPRRPFIVHSGATQVRAVGTQFDVNLKQAGVVVTVIEGKVAVSSNSPAVNLSAGEQLSARAHTIPIPARADVAVAIAWTQRQIVLNSAPLVEVAEEFNRYSTKPMRVIEAEQEELRLSGVFATDPDFLIRYLRARPDVVVEETDTEIRIVHRDRR